MKRTGIILMLMLMLTTSAYAVPMVVRTLAPSEGELAMEQAIALGKNIACEKRSTTLADIEGELVRASLAELESGEHAWIVSIFDDAFADPMLVSVMIDALNGEILDVFTTTYGYFGQVRDAWKLQKGEYDFWSLEDKALFDRLYREWDYHVVPNNTVITQQQAMEIALQAVPVSLRNCQCSYTFVQNQPQDGKVPEFQWIVTIWSNEQKKYQVIISAEEGTVLDVFDLGTGLG